MRALGTGHWALVGALLVTGCKERPPEAPPAPVPLSREAVAAAQAQTRAGQAPPAGAFGPWGRWEKESIGKPYVRLNSVWGTGPKDVWVLGSQRLETMVVHQDGTGWQVVQTFDGEGHAVLGGRGPEDRWVVGSFARHAAGPGELTQALDQVGSRALRFLAAAPDGTLWAGGDAGELLHQARPGEAFVKEQVGPEVPAYKGGRTSPTTRNEQPSGKTRPGLNALFAAGNTLVAVGELGTVLVKGQEGWEVEPSGTPQELRGVWGAAPDDLWAVGDRGTILRRRGASWEQVGSGTGADLYAVHGTRADDIWAVGSAGALLHWDGKVWTPIPSGTQEPLLALWGDGKGQLWAVGGNATVLHHRPD